MTFRVVEPANCTGRANCRPYILASGRITQDSHRDFHRVAARLPRGMPVHLSSPGGTLFGGMLLGLSFRERRATVYVARRSVCASACAYAFLGGVRRQVPPGTRLGVHRFYAASGEYSALSRVEQQVLAQNADVALRGYIGLMGVKPELATLAGRIAPTSIHYLSAPELHRYGVVTGGARRQQARAAARRKAWR